MAAVHVIPCLDVNGGRVVKGVNFVDLQDKGDPVEFARRYVEQGADELVFLDISATVEDRATTVDMVREVAKVIPIPFSVGGGVRSVEDAQRLIDAGANKIGVNSAAINRPELVNELALSIGSDALVLAIDVKVDPSQPSGYVVLTHGGKTSADVDAVAWAVEVAERGAGSILLTSLTADGTQEGYDLDITRQVAESVSVPVVASGGAGRIEDFVPAVQAGAAHVLAASVFHNGTFTVADVKNVLAEAGYEVTE